MGKEFVKTALDMCNTWGKITSVIFIILLIIGVVFFYNDKKTYKETKGIVKSVQKNGCVDKQRIVNNSRSSRMEMYSDCYLTVVYKVNGKQITHDLHTEDVVHEAGGTIDLEYNINNPQMVRVNNQMYKYYLWGCIIGLLVMSVTLYLRMYHFDNKYVKAFVGISCMQNLLSNYN